MPPQDIPASPASGLTSADLPAPTPAVLRAALGRFATGVTIITCAGPEGRSVGLTANSFSALSLDPPLVLWSLRQASGSLAAFDAAPHYRVHVGDHFWHWLYLPLAALVERLARLIGLLQQGRIAVYLLYSFVTLMIVLAVVKQ